MGQAAAQYVPQAAAAIGESVNTAFGFRQVDKAADDLTLRQNQANALNQGLYDTTSAQYQPYVEGGADSYSKLLATYGVGTAGGKPDYSGFESSPDYLWAQQQGIRGRDMSAASTGRLYSGAYDKALAGYNQGLATQNLDNYRRGLFNISNQGIGATNALANYRQGYATSQTAGINELGNIAAAERMGLYAVNSKHNANMQNIHGVGGGGSSYMPQGQNSLNAGGQTGAGWDANGWNQSGYNYGSVANNFNWGG